MFARRAWWRRSKQQAGPSPSAHAAPADPVGSDLPDTMLPGPLYPDYRPRYADKAQELFEELVPPSGPASTLQGELLRVVEKLWFEGQDNGNINWCSDFEIFLDLLAEHLLVPGELDEADRQMAARSIDVLRNCGRQAYRNKPDWASAGLDEEDIKRYPALLDEPRGVGAIDFGYTENDVYQHLRDCAVIFAANHPEPIPYQAPPGLSH